MTMFGRRGWAGGGASFWVSRGAAHAVVRIAATKTKSGVFKECLQRAVQILNAVYLYQHMDSEAREAYRTAFAECSIDRIVQCHHLSRMTGRPGTFANWIH
jgi:hypothetical protein